MKSYRENFIFFPSLNNIFQHLKSESSRFFSPANPPIKGADPRINDSPPGARHPFNNLYVGVRNAPEIFARYWLSCSLELFILLGCVLAFAVVVCSTLIAKSSFFFSPRTTAFSSRVIMSRAREKLECRRFLDGSFSFFPPHSWV